MKITILIIILTFIYTILDRFILNEKENYNDKPDKNFFYKIIKSKYTLLILLFGLLVFQLISEYNSRKAENIRDTNTNNAFDTLYQTHSNVKQVNSSIDSLFSSIDSTIDITRAQLELISNVNSDLEKVRFEFNKSINEFKSIRQQYEKQIKIEKEKIKEAKPNIEIAKASYNLDSISFGYTFELYNSGIRLADSIIYHSLVVLVDSNYLPKDIVLYKTNSNEANILSISHSDNNINFRVFNSAKLKLNGLDDFFSAYFIIKYEYKDNLTNITQEKFSIYVTKFEIGKQQFGSNVSENDKKVIMQHLLKNDKRLYEIFYD